MSRQVREVNIIPLTKIKIEKLSEDEEENTVSCKVCSKSFVSEIALRNHARIEHIDRYLLGEDMCVRHYVKTKRKYNEQEKEAMKKRTEELISSMEPTNLMSLASNDVSYIIIKADGEPQVKKFRKEKIKVEKEKPVREIKHVRKEKEVQAISGPFECLQPSTIAASGLCHQMFLSCCEYSLHWRDEHTRRRKGLRCQVCEKPLVAMEQPFMCQVCGMGFENSKELSIHSQTAHIKLKPFECSICHKRFTQQGGVQQHMRLHTGDKPFACSYCSKTFTQKSGLDQHLRIHTKVKPYRCVICGKSFCQSIHLQQHMRTHTNVAPFQCGICQKRFKQSSHLNYHLKYHNPANMTEEQKEKYNELMLMMGRHQTVEVNIEENVQEENVQDEYKQEENIQEDNYVLMENEVWCENE